MDAATLYTAMGGVLSPAKYAELVGPMNDAMLAANITTVNRAAMWCAQIGHESVGLKYREEIASGAAYEGRRDLGNVVRGDGVLYKGRGPIQLTGRHNYGKFSDWCRAKGYTNDARLFVNQPTLVGLPKWGFLAASWYWTVARPALNSYADAGNVLAATRAINGGTNGLADRQRRWNLARPLGVRLLPSPGLSSLEDDELNADQDRMLRDLHDRICRLEKAWPGGVTDDKDTPYDLRLLANRQNVEQRQTWVAVQALSEKIDLLIAADDVQA